MHRRTFIRKAGLGLAAAATLRMRGAERPFRLKYAPHPGQFRHLAGEDLIAQLHFIAEQGFRAFEDNDMRRRPVEEQVRIGQTLRALGLEMGVFVAHPIPWDRPALTGGDPEARAQFLREMAESVAVAERVGARWMTVVPGMRHPRRDEGYQTAHLVETLRQAAAILEPHGLVMVLEPLNTRRDHPGMFLTHIAQAYAICRAVNSPSCKILYDVYHQQITEGNLMANFEAAWEEVAYIQVGDVPGRKEPTTGEIHFKNLFRFLAERGYEGIIGMEHGASRPGAEGERAVIAAYRAVDPA